MTQTRILIRIDDDVACAALVRGKGRHSRVRWAGVTRDLAPAQLAAYVRASIPAADPSRSTVVLMVGDRRIITGTVQRDTAPARAELATFIEDQAREKGMFAAGEQLSIGYCKQSAGGRWRAFYEAAPAQAHAAFVDALQAQGYARVQVVSTANVLAQGMAAGDEVVGIVDVRGNAAHFVLAARRHTLAMRKILLPLGLRAESGIDSLLPLGSELARSIGYFTDQGLPRPGAVIFTPLPIADVDVATFFADILELPCRICAEPALQCLPDPLPHPELSWAAHALAAVSLLPKDTPFLVDVQRRPQLRLRVGSLLPIGGIAAAAAGVALLLIANSAETRQRWQQQARLHAEVRRIEHELAIEQQRHEIPPIVIRRSNALKQLAKTDAIGNRVSLSRICALLGSLRADGVALREIRLDKGQLVLAGLIRESAGVQAVAAFGRLDERLRAVPGIGAGSGRLRRQDGERRGLPFEYTVALGARPQ